MYKFLSVLAALALAAPAVAADYSFTGNLANDASVQLIGFSVGSTSTVTLKSYGYAGGTMADGTTINYGGLDTILSLFDSSGNLITYNDDGGCSNVGTDPNTGRCYDTYLQSTLAAGNYTVAVTQFSNFAIGPNLSNGFQQSSPTFTASYGCSDGQFCDVTGSNRTSFWAYDVLGVNSAATVSPVPLPASLPLLLAGIGALGAFGRRKRRARAA